MAVATASQSVPIQPLETYPIVDEQYIEAPALVYIEPVITPLASPSLGVRCSCVNYAKTLLGGISEPWGYPNRMATKSLDPYVGGLVLTNEGPLGHVAVITALSSTSMTVTEANFVPCAVTTRTLPRSSSVVRGFW